MVMGFFWRKPEVKGTPVVTPNQRVLPSMDYATICAGNIVRVCHGDREACGLDHSKCVQ